MHKKIIMKSVTYIVTQHVTMTTIIIERITQNKIIKYQKVFDY